MALVSTMIVSGLTRSAKTALWMYPAARSYAVMLFSVAVAIFYRGSRQDVYNILWAVVFGFATLNILSLAARRMEPARRGMTFGELLAVMVVLISVFLLGWEMLTIFHVFPLKLRH
jgi:hypothetical protein